MKSYEAFRASVYEKAAVRRARIRRRNQAIRNSTFCAVLVLAAAFFSYTRSNTLLMGFQKPDLEKNYVLVTRHDSVEQAQNRSGQVVEPQLLVLVKSEGKAMLLKNSEERKEFARQYSPADPAQKGTLMQPENISGKTIHSKDEFSAYLAEVQESGEPLQAVVDEYDEVFFSSNDLCAVPMDLTIGEPTTAEAATTETAVPDETMAELPTTIPDGSSLEFTEALTADGLSVTADENATLPFPSSLAALEQTALSASGVKVLILVPVQK